MQRCKLPLTGLGVVDLIITEIAVIEVVPTGLRLKEVATDSTIDAVQNATEARLIVEGPIGRF